MRPNHSPCKPFKCILLLTDKACSISMFTLRASFTAEAELEQGSMHRAGMDTTAANLNRPTPTDCSTGTDNNPER